MTMLATLKGVFYFLAIIALIFLAVIMGEMAVLIFLEMREKRRGVKRDHGGREWWDAPENERKVD